MNFLDKLIHKDNHSILAVTHGKVLHIEKIPDHAFSNRLIGDGLAIEINSPPIFMLLVQEPLILLLQHDMHLLYY